MDFTTHFNNTARFRNNRERKPLSASSIKLYSAQLGKLTNLKGEVEFTDYDGMKDIIEKNFPSYLTQKNYVSSIIAYLETLPATEQIDSVLDKYDELRVIGNNKYNSDLQNGELQGKQKENVVSKAEIKRLMKKVKDELKVRGSKEKFQFLLMLHTYTLFPMRNELATIRFADIMDFNDNKDDKYSKGNYLVKTDNIYNYKNKQRIGTAFYKFVFNEYKTGKTYGQRVIELPIALRKLFDLYIYEYNISEGDAVFTLKSGKDMDTVNLSKFLRRNFQSYLGKDISTTILRKIYYGSKYNKEEMEDLVEDAKNAGHSPATAMAVYTTKSIPK